MAWPPRKTRSGTSRRARTFAFLGRSFLTLAIGVAIGLLVMSRLAPDRADDLRGAAADVVAPFWAVLQVPVETVAGIWNDAGAYVDAARRVQRLEKRELLYREHRRRYDKAIRENAELKSLLDVVDPEQTRVGVFAIAGASGGAAARQAIVAGGAQDGVESGQPVRTAAGLIGRTVEVGRNAARVLLITDASSRIPVRVVRTGIPALLLGQGDATVEIDLTGPTSNDVVLGDRLVTSGDGGLFAPGIPVATVVAPDEPRPLARPAALPALGQFVLVEQPYVPPLSPIAEDMFDIMPEAARPADAPLP